MLKQTGETPEYGISPVLLKKFEKCNILTDYGWKNEKCIIRKSYRFPDRNYGSESDSA